jgi:hypothetical protein
MNAGHLTVLRCMRMHTIPAQLGLAPVDSIVEQQ